MQSIQIRCLALINALEAAMPERHLLEIPQSEAMHLALCALNGAPDNMQSLQQLASCDASLLEELYFAISGDEMNLIHMEITEKLLSDICYSFGILTKISLKLVA
jgi:hypothetical protein